MHQKHSLNIKYFILILFCISCKINSNCDSITTDISDTHNKINKDDEYTIETSMIEDDTIFREVKIFDQIWSSKNLNVSKFRNGDIIMHAQTPQEWISAIRDGTPAWCYYKNDPDLGRIFGKLYNFYAVIDPRGIAPKGYHIPSTEEIKILFANFDERATYANDGKGLKDLMANKYWRADEYRLRGNGNDKYSFSAVPSGIRNGQSQLAFFNNIGLVFSFWLTSVDKLGEPSYCIIDGLGNWHIWESHGSNLIVFGYAIRCIKDYDSYFDSGKLNQENKDEPEKENKIDSFKYN